MSDQGSIAQVFKLDKLKISYIAVHPSQFSAAYHPTSMKPDATIILAILLGGNIESNLSPTPPNPCQWQSIINTDL
jgi:hypothetical protein